MIDPRPNSGSNYYRLMQIDFDGQFEYSNIEHILWNNDKYHNISVYPNPSSGIVNIDGDFNNVNIQVFAVDQTLVRDIQHHSGSAIINLNNLSDGLYFIKIKNESQNEIYTKKLILSK